MNQAFFYGTTKITESLILADADLDIVEGGKSVDELLAACLAQDPQWPRSTVGFQSRRAQLEKGRYIKRLILESRARRRAA